MSAPRPPLRAQIRRKKDELARRLQEADTFSHSAGVATPTGSRISVQVSDLASMGPSVCFAGGRGDLLEA